jgi:hypothetical protein
MSQNKLLLAALKREPWSSRDIYIHLGIGRAASRINELRRKFNIETKMIAVKNRYGDTCRVAEYHYVGKL